MTVYSNCNVPECDICRLLKKHGFRDIIHHGKRVVFG